MYWAEVKSDFYQITVHLITSIHYILWLKKHVHQDKGKIYACFIDFKKAFDSIWHQGLFYELIESGIGGKTYDLIKSMYTESKCGVKINTKHTRYLSQERGVRQACCLSPTLFNIYINELALSLERSAAPGLTLHDSEIKCLLYADYLVLLSPTKHGLQQNLDHTARPGPWQSTWRKPTLWSFRKDPDPREHNTYLH